MESEKHSNQELVDENLAEGQDDAQAPTMETRSKGDYGALWLLAGVVALAGGTLWMIRDVWTDRPVAAELPQLEAPAGQAASASVLLPGQAGESAPGTEQEGEAGLSSEQDDHDLRRRQRAERLTELKLEAERMERERLVAEQELQAERAAREALERERQAAEQRLAREREVREALEQERRAAEQKLAREREARAELERKASLEKQRLLQARQAAEQASLDRARAEAELEQANARAAAASEAPAAVAEPSVAEPVTPERIAPETDAPQQAAGGSSFSSNPCDGPSAKFLSTCR